MYKILIKENTTSNNIINELVGNNNYKIKKNKYGYPYFENIDNLYFNISNKDNISIGILSDKRVGIDLEKPIYKEKLLNRYFTKDEKEFILNSKNKEIDFCKIWIMKESFVKMKGIGLSYGLDRVDTFKFRDLFYIYRYKNYYYCVCFEN